MWWKPIAYFLSADSCFPSITSQSPVKRKLYGFTSYLPTDVFHMHFNHAQKKWEKDNDLCFIVDKEDYAVSVCGD